MEVILIIGAVQAFFFSILILNKKGKSISDKILVFWLLLFAAHFSYLYMLFNSGAEIYIKYSGYDSGILIVHYSILYVYSKSLISKINKFQIKWLLHIIPVVIIYLIIFPYLNLSLSEKLDLIKLKYIDLILYSTPLLIALFSTVIFYTISLNRLFKKHSEDIKTKFSYNKNIDLKWLRTLSYTFGAIWFAMLIIGIISFIILQSDGKQDIVFYTTTDLIGYNFFVIFIYIFGYYGYKQNRIFSNTNTVIEVNTTDELAPKYTNNNNSESRKDKEFILKFKKYMVTNKPFLNCELSLYDLSKELNISTHYLSYVLNKYLHKNFYEFVNKYRVEEVKTEIIKQEKSNFTILAIAYDCGFNSKATFNRIFKNYTGDTPSQFQKRYLNN